MALVKCKECDKEISKKAEKCPHCGAPAGAKQYSLLSLIIVIGLIWMFWEIFSPAGSSSSSTPSSNSSSPLKLLSSSCTHGNGHFHVEGEVQNISNKKLENVMAVGELRAKDGTLVKSADALLEYNPLMPNQTTPFHVITTDNPIIKTCEISFKYLMGGQIPYTNAVKKK